MFVIPENTTLVWDHKEFSILNTYTPQILESCWLVTDAQKEKYILKIFDFFMDAKEQEKMLQGLALVHGMPSLHIMPILHCGLLPHQDNEPILQEGQWKAMTKPSGLVPFVLLPYSSVTLEEILQTETKEETKIDYALQLCLAVSALQKMNVASFFHRNPIFQKTLSAPQIFLFQQGKKWVLKILPFALGISSVPRETEKTSLESEDAFPLLALSALLDKLVESPSPEGKELLESLRRPASTRDVHVLGKLIGYLWEAQKRLEKNRRAYSLFLLGVNLCKQGFYKYALDDFQNAFALNPLLIDALIFEGYAWQSLGKGKEAHEIYADVLSRGAGNFFLYENRALLYAEEERYEDAISDLQKAISLKDDAASAYGLLGTVYSSMEKWLEALEAFSKVILLEENFAPAYVDRGDVFLALGEREKAILDYQKALSLDSNLVEVEEKIAALKE